MTKLLEQALAKASALSDQEQDALARLVLEEIESDKWDATSAKGAEKLRKLADEAWAEFESGKTEELNPDTL